MSTNLALHFRLNPGTGLCDTQSGVSSRQYLDHRTVSISLTRGRQGRRRIRCSAAPEPGDTPRLRSEIINRFATCLCASTFSIFAICPGTTPSTIDAFLQTEVYGSGSSRATSSAATASAPPAPDRPAVTVAPLIVPSIVVTPNGTSSAHPPSTDPLYSNVVPLVKDRPAVNVDQLSPAEREKYERDKAEKERLERERSEKAKADAERLLKEKEEQARKEKEKKAQEEKIRKQKEREKKEKEEAARRAEVRKRAAEARRRQYEREALIAGGSVGLGFFSLAKWPVILELFGGAFRLIGGPTLVSAALRTPGYILGKNLRLVEWDLQNSPSHPDGNLVTINLRQFTSSGLRTAIAKAYNLDSPKQVKQIAHWILIGPHFYEPTGPQQSLVSLPDNAVLVWTKVSPSQLVMPCRGDRLPTQATAGVSKHLAQKSNNTEPQTDMLRAIAALAALSRGEKDVIIAHEGRREAERSRDESPSRPDPALSERSNGASRNGSSAPHSSDSRDDDGNDDYVNGGLLAWLASARRASSKPPAPTPAIHGYSDAPAPANGNGDAESSRSNGASSNGAWQVLAEVRRRAESQSDGASSSQNGQQSATAVLVPASEPRKSPSASNPEAAAARPETSDTKEPLDASVRAVSWQAVKRVGLANVRMPASFEVIDVALEERMVGAAASGDPGLLRLFEAFAMQDVFRFMQYARAYVESRPPGSK